MSNLDDATDEFGEPLMPYFVNAIRDAANEIESGPQYAGTVLHALVADLFTLGYKPEETVSEPEWTAEPPECDCWLGVSGRPAAFILRWDGTAWCCDSIAVQWRRETLIARAKKYDMKFCAIPDGIPKVPA